MHKIDSFSILLSNHAVVCYLLSMSPNDHVVLSAKLWKIQKVEDLTTHPRYTIDHTRYTIGHNAFVQHKKKSTILLQMSKIQNL